LANTNDLKTIIRNLYAARVAGDADRVVAGFADDVTFHFNGEGAEFPGLDGPIKGKKAVAATIRHLTESFRFEEWREQSLIAEGDQAALHWTARVVFTPTGQSEIMDVQDLFAFKDGKVIELRQSTDTAKIKALVSR
jgi:ketosteroid isomerase-like protein